jgi:hypothetical protein
MGTGKKKQIRIIKQGMAGNIPKSEAAPVSRERPKKDPKAELIFSISGWVTKFKERRRLDPRITFQALFKEP